jgi:predicted transcriptional regulator
MDLYEISAHLDELTAHQLRVLQIVYDGGGKWLTRAKLAKALGKRRLTPYDINCLKMLCDKGIIEEGTQDTTAPGSDFAYVYHMSDRIAELVQQWSEQRAQQLREAFVPENYRPPLRLAAE